MEETKLKERKLTKRKITMLVILGIVLLIGISYAIWQMVFVQSNPNLLSNSCFTTAFIEGEAIDLNNAFPMTNNESKTLSPFTFTIKNTCDLAAQYQINLEVLPTTPDSPLSNEYVRSSLNNSGGNILTDLSEVETTIPTATKSFMLKTGTLPSGASVTYDLRLWMDEDTPLIEGQNKVFKSKIVIITSPTVSPNILMAVSDVDCDEWGHCTGFLGGGDIDLQRTNIETITFTNTNEVPLDALYSWDVSEAQDGSVMAWYKEGVTPGMYAVWIGGKGGVTANPDSSHLFNCTGMPSNTDFNIDFTYFDTSLVTDMSYMFADSSPLDNYNLDLSDWNVSNVTNMQGMFHYFCYDDAPYSCSIDLSSWDTSNVTDMSNMFSDVGHEYAAITIAGLNTWNVSKVTDMSGMFASTGYRSDSLILDLNGWDVSSVEDMSDMFWETGYRSSELYLEGLENWDVSNVTNMQGMFYFTGVETSVFTLDLTSWNVSKVTDMSMMFYGIAYNNPTFSLGDLSDWKTLSVIDMNYMFASVGMYNPTFTLGDLSDWETSNVTNMGGMFSCTFSNSANVTLDLRNWDISNVTDMSSMFGGYCSWETGLTNLHLENWDLPTATKTGMFRNSNNKAAPDNLKIYVKDAAMETWLKDYGVTFLPANATVIY